MFFTTRPEIRGTFGVVTSTHWLATAAGMAMLEKGGNAFDAAVATGVALNVVEPHQNGPGGEVPLIVYSKAKDKVEVICGQGPAPAAATIDAYRDLGLDMVPGIGLLSAVVPGSFGAWMLMLRDYGRLSLREVLEPAIGYALNGHYVTEDIAGAIVGVRALFEEAWPTSADVYLPGGAPPEAGGLMRNPTMAATYQRLIAEAEAAGGDRDAQIEAARAAWYEGFVAEAIDRFCRETKWVDSSGRRHGGLVTGDDMARWRPTVEAPVTYDYHGYTVCKAGPWSQGPVALQQLALLKGFDLAGMGSESADFVHTVIECTKLAMADREAFYGDPDFVDVPFDVLLSDAYNDERRALVGAEASHEITPGTVPGHGAPIKIRPKRSTEYAHVEAHVVGGPEPLRRLDRAIATAIASASDTCHFDIIDGEGNMVSGTPSGGWMSGTPSGGWMSGSPAIPELGFPISQRGQMFWLDEDHPTGLAPGKRPRTTLTPGLALRDGEPYMVFGTLGGDQKDQWATHAFLRHIHFGHDLQRAIEEPEFHTKHTPSSFFPRECDPGHLSVEARFSEPVLNDLADRGHRIEVYGDYSLGYVTAATRDGGMLRAGASPRHVQCYAAGR